MEDPTPTRPQPDPKVKPKPKAQGEGGGPEKTPTEVVIEKKIERIVAEGGLVDPHAGVGGKFRKIFGRADFKGTMHFVWKDVVLPAAKAVALDALWRGGEHAMYRGASPTVGPAGRIYGAAPGTRVSSVSYTGPAYRPGQTTPPTGHHQAPITTQVVYPQTLWDEYILVNRADAVRTVQQMGDLIETYGLVTVADLHEMLGRQISHTENKFGWDHLRGVEVVNHPHGWQITLGPPGEIAQS